MITVTRIQMIPGLSLVSAKLIEAMKDGRPGDILTDDQLQTVCGLSVAPKGAAYGNLATAIRHCIRHRAIVWKRVIRQKCIKCLEPLEVMETGRSEVLSTRRRTRRAAGKMRTVNLEKIPEADRPEYMALAAQLSTMCLFSRDKVRVQLESRHTDSPIDIGRLLEAFKTETSDDD